MPRFDSVASLAEAAGSTVGHTDWRTISDSDVQQFADLTGDHQWIHVDHERACTDGPFGTPIVHGALTAALVPVFVGELMSVDGASSVVNAGFERLRLRTPVPVGTRVRGKATLMSVEPHEHATRAVVRCVVELEGSSKPACVADQVMVIHV